MLMPVTAGISSAPRARPGQPAARTKSAYAAFVGAKVFVPWWNPSIAMRINLSGKRLRAACGPLPAGERRDHAEQARDHPPTRARRSAHRPHPPNLREKKGGE